MKTFGRIIALAFVLFHSVCEPYDDAVRPIPSPDNLKKVTIDTYLPPEVKDYGDGSMPEPLSGFKAINICQ
jgi:hypothetical protein